MTNENGNPIPEKETKFLDGFYLGVAEYQVEGGDNFLGLVMEDLDVRYFMPFWREPNDHLRQKFTEAFKRFDEKYSNIGLRD